MADIIRASSLMGFQELVTALGGDANALFDTCGVPPAIVGDYEKFLPYTKLAALLGAAAEQLDKPNFGLLLADYQDVEMFGPLAVLLRYSHTVEDALKGLIRYLHTYTPAVNATLRSGSPNCAFTFEVAVKRIPHPGQIYELTMGVVLDMFQQVTGSDFKPIRILFSHSQISTRAVYEERLRSPIEFDAPMNALVFPSEVLRRALDTEDSQAFALAERYLGSQQHHNDLAASVSAVQEKLLPLGQATLTSVAQSLLLHPRVLQRRLEEQGTAFDDLLDTVRMRSARKLLTETDLPMSMIAQQLGYSEQSSLSRSCRRWFGTSATRIRRNRDIPA